IWQQLRYNAKPRRGRLRELRRPIVVDTDHGPAQLWVDHAHTKDRRIHDREFHTVPVHVLESQGGRRGAQAIVPWELDPVEGDPGPLGVRKPPSPAPVPPDGAITDPHFASVALFHTGAAVPELFGQAFQPEVCREIPEVDVVVGRDHHISHFYLL